ncbi:MAG: hypothetical protein ACPG4A_10670, partial [Pseudomonadales bacterium]
SMCSKGSVLDSPSDPASQLKHRVLASMIVNWVYGRAMVPHYLKGMPSAIWTRDCVSALKEC